MYVLFTKEMCGLCEKIKETFDLEGLGIDICEADSEIASVRSSNVIGTMAWYEILHVQEKHGFPLLVKKYKYRKPGEKVVFHGIEVVKKLEELKGERDGREKEN